MYIVARHQENITINDLEYLLDDNSNLMSFTTKEDAVNFLINNGYTLETIENSIKIIQN